MVPDVRCFIEWEITIFKVVLKMRKRLYLLQNRRANILMMEQYIIQSIGWKIRWDLGIDEFSERQALKLKNECSSAQIAA